MTVKLFILGLPGSGKSSVTRYIATYLEDKDWESTHFSDHVILQKMFHADTEGKQFKPAEHSGFDVLDLTVFDEALQRLEQEVNNKHISSSTIPAELVMIEFARNDYQGALQQFSQEFLQDTCFLYLDVDVEICKRRIRERVVHPMTMDDFFVSEDIFKTYYNKDDGRSIPQILERDYGIDKQRVKVIENNGSLDNIVAQIKQFVDNICGLEITPGA